VRLPNTERFRRRSRAFSKRRFTDAVFRLEASTGVPKTHSLDVVRAIRCRAAGQATSRMALRGEQTTEVFGERAK